MPDTSVSRERLPALQLFISVGTDKAAEMDLEHSAGAFADLRSLFVVEPASMGHFRPP